MNGYAKTAVLSFLMAGMVFAADEPKAAMDANASPGDVCKQLVEAAKKDDFDAVKKMSKGEPHGKQAKGHFHKMHGEYMERLKNIGCGSDLVADDHAVVEAQTEGKKRLIPFVKEESGWKFDAMTYMTFYPHGKMAGHKKGK